MAKTETLLQFKAKVNLPGGITKGDIIDFHPVKKKYIHTKTNTELMWNCDKEEKFFARVIAPKYNVNDSLCVKIGASFPKVGSFPNYSKNKGNTFFIPAFTELKVIALDGPDYIVQISQNSPSVKIPEKTLHKCEFWYFYNSDGILSRVFAGKEQKKEEFCKSIGNYFLDKADGPKWLKQVAKFKK